MITDAIQNALKAYMDSRIPLESDLTGLNVYTQANDSTKAYPALVIVATGVEEHEVLRGCYTVDLDLLHQTTLDGDSDTTEEHEARNAKIENWIKSEDCLTYVSGSTNLRLVDIRGGGGTTSVSNGRWETAFEITAKGNLIA